MTRAEKCLLIADLFSCKCLLLFHIVWNGLYVDQRNKIDIYFFLENQTEVWISPSFCSLYYKLKRSQCAIWTPGLGTASWYWSCWSNSKVASLSLLYMIYLLFHSIWKLLLKCLFMAILTCFPWSLFQDDLPSVSCQSFLHSSVDLSFWLFHIAYHTKYHCTFH